MFVMLIVMESVDDVGLGVRCDVETTGIVTVFPVRGYVNSAETAVGEFVVDDLERMLVDKVFK